MARRYEGHLSVYRPELQQYLTPIFRGYSTSVSPLCKRLGSPLDTRGRYNPETLSALHDLAVECDRLEKEEEARLLFLEAFDGRARGLGMNDLDTLESACKLALILDRQMKYEDALKWYKQVFQYRLDVLGKGNPDTMAVGHLCASVCEKLGKNGEAKDYFLKVFFVRSDKLGNDHPDTLTTAHRLGSVCEKLGRYDDSYKWYTMVLNNRLKVLGKRDQDTSDTYHRMLSLCTQRDDKQGRDAVEKAWAESPESMTPKKNTTKTLTISEVLEFEDGQKLSTTYDSLRQVRARLWGSNIFSETSNLSVSLFKVTKIRQCLLVFRRPFQFVKFINFSMLIPRITALQRKLHNIDGISSR